MGVSTVGSHIIRKIQSFNEITICPLLGRGQRKRDIERLTNFNPTIISNNCIAGIILHNLRLRFNTPTINLWIERSDFIKYVNNLVEYSRCELIEKDDRNINYPVGILKGGPGDIQVHFNHSKTFCDAKEKWDQRCKRINYDNIYIIMEGGKDIPYDMLLAFNRIPYKNKVVITGRPYPEIESAFCIPIYDEKYRSGMILDYEGMSGRRYLNRFDYVSFLNQH